MYKTHVDRFKEAADLELKNNTPLAQKTKAEFPHGSRTLYLSVISYELMCIVREETIKQKILEIYGS